MAEKKKDDYSRTDALYQWISYDLQNIRAELLNELKLSSAQIASLYGSITNGSGDSTMAIAQEIRYSYKQNQNIYDGLSAILKGEVAERLAAMDEKVANLDQLQAILNEISELKFSYMQLQSVYEGLAATLSGDVLSRLDEIVGEEEMKNLVEESATVHTQKVLDAIAAAPVPENVDYARISEEVGDKLLELLNELKATESAVRTDIDYEKIAGDTAAKVVESLPYPESFDYNKVNDSVAEGVSRAIDMDAITGAVAQAIDTDAIANAVAQAIDVEAVANAVVEKMTPPTVDYDYLADLVLEKLAEKGISADVVLDDEGIDKIAETVAEKVQPQASFTLGDEDVEKIVGGVADELRNMTLVCECAQMEAEPVVEEAVEEMPVEEPVVEEELAVAAEPIYEEDVDGQLIDAETGLVVRLKRSFTAKMKQSEDRIKEYYSDIKNELTSYKRINSNVSWHGDRFNFGRDTVAKMGINGKTLCFYLALDPNDPELKQTVYHQKNVGEQKAYESTPFMVKIKSDAAAKKALRLVGILATKLAAVKETDFVPTDYVGEFGYESTKRLFEDGYIKATKEKKVDFSNF